jgi:hypothetical protein
VARVGDRGGGPADGRRAGGEDGGGEARAGGRNGAGPKARAACWDDGATRWLANERVVAYEADGAIDRCRVAVRRHRAHDQQQSHH